MAQLSPGLNDDTHVDGERHYASWEVWFKETAARANASGLSVVLFPPPQQLIEEHGPMPAPPWRRG